MRVQLARRGEDVRELTTRLAEVAATGGGTMPVVE
jgi:hypothetical protein